MTSDVCCHVADISLYDYYGLTWILFCLIFFAGLGYTTNSVGERLLNINQKILLYVALIVCIYLEIDCILTVNNEQVYLYNQHVNS